MNIRFTISPLSTSIPLLIINDKQGAEMAKMPRQQVYNISHSISSADRKRGSLDISGVLRGPADSPVVLQIDVFFAGPHKPPVSRTISGQYSNLSNMIFMASVALPKSTGGFQGGRH